MAKEKVSQAVVRRLPRYFRHLEELELAGVVRVSSSQLARRMGITASQMRQDLNCFGGFGQQGYGYNVEKLRHEIASILGLDNRTNAVIIGVGNIGRALINNFSFERRGFNLAAAFDLSPQVAGTVLNGVPIHHINTLEDYFGTHATEVAVLTLPAQAAPPMAERLVRCGVRGLWNFTNTDLHLINDAVMVENVHFGDSLMTLCYRLRQEGAGLEEA